MSGDTRAAECPRCEGSIGCMACGWQPAQPLSEDDATAIRRILRIPPMGEEEVYGALNLGSSRIREHKTSYKPHLQDRDADTLHFLKERIMLALATGKSAEDSP